MRHAIVLFVLVAAGFQKDNDQPALARGLACAAGTKLITDQSTPGGVDLNQHAASAATLAKIAADAWDFVVMDADPETAVLPTALWKSVGYHSALAGSYLAAAALVGMLLDTETEALTYMARLDEAVASYLRAVADRVVRADKADPLIGTAERVNLNCPYSDACSDAADARSVTFMLSEDSCDELSAGSASIAGWLRTTTGCRGECTTVPLSDWHDVAGDALEDGAYQVHVHVDMNENGALDSGDREACEAGAITIQRNRLHDQRAARIVSSPRILGGTRTSG